MAQSWCQWKKFFFHGLWARTYFKRVFYLQVLLLSSIILLNVSTFFIVFYNNFTIINTILFFIFTRLQLFNYLSPRELSPPAQYDASTFSTFRNIFFHGNGNIYFISKVFRFTLQTLVELSLSGEPKNFFRSTKFNFTEKRKLFFNIFSFSFPSDPARGVSGKGLVPD